MFVGGAALATIILGDFFPSLVLERQFIQKV